MQLLRDAMSLAPYEPKCFLHWHILQRKCVYRGSLQSTASATVVLLKPFVVGAPKFKLQLCACQVVRCCFPRRVPT